MSVQVVVCMSNFERRGIRNLKVMLNQLEESYSENFQVDLVFLTNCTSSRQTLNIGSSCLPDLPELHIAFKHETQRNQASLRDNLEEQ